MKITRAQKAWDLEGDPRFELRRPLGSGSFGDVFEVFDRERGARVALKMLASIDPAEIYRFKQEFRALADMVHPNLVRLYELLSDGDRWLFTMELVEGKNVLAFVRRGHSSPDLPTLLDTRTSEPAIAPANHDAGARFHEARLRSVLRQLAEGLSALHEGGKMHRDVKPGNVLVTPEGRVVLVDFGLAVRLSASGEISRSTLVGTPAYLAPELVRGEPATAASDWYAVGVLLYEALTGKLPFVGTLEQILSEKLTRDPAVPSAIADGVPPDLERLCMALLSQHPDARPTGRDLLERFGSDVAARSGPREIPFVGRAAERTALADLYREVTRGGSTGVALIGGPSGIGKSALVDKVCADIRATSSRAVVLAGRCWEQESVPYKAIDGLVDPLSRHLKSMPTPAVAALLPAEVRTLARLFPALDDVPAIAHALAPVYVLRDAHDLRRAAFRALRELLAKLAKERPLVLVIDDLQWGDQDSGALLIDLLAPPDPPPLLLIVSFRSDEEETSACLRAALPALRAMQCPEIRVASLAIDALPENDAWTLARALVPDAVGDDLAAAVAREAGGRPFFIRELAELEKDRGRSSPRGEPSLDALVRDRVSALPEAARRLLEIIAVAGRPVNRAAAARAADLGDGDLAAYGALRAARLVRRREAADRDEIEPYHDRIREAVTKGLSLERRTETFRRLAAALYDSGRADPETLASYFLEAGSSTRAMELFTLAAADASRQLAFDRAARLYRRALDLRDSADAGSADLHEVLAEALVNAGRSAEAAEAFTVAARAAPAARAFELRRRAAEHMLFAGRVDEGTAAIRGALAEVDVAFPEGSTRVALALLLQLAWLLVHGLQPRRIASAVIPRAAQQRIDACLVAAKAFSSVDTLPGAYFGARALVIAHGAGDTERAFEAHCTFLMYATALLGVDHWLARRSRSALHQLGATLGSPRVRGLMSLFDGIVAMLGNDLRAAPQLLANAARILGEERVDVAWEANALREFTFQHLLWSGGWKALCRELRPALADARDRGNQHLERALTLRFGHIPHLLADDPEGALRTHDAGRAGWWPARFTTLDCFVLWSRGDILLYVARGRGHEAHAHVEGMWGALRRSHLLRVAVVHCAALGARARAALAALADDGASHRERANAQRIARQCGRALGARRDRLSRGLGALVDGAVAAATEDDFAARDRFTLAEAELDAAGCAHYAAAAKRRRGLLIGGDEGRTLVTEAEDRLRAQGAENPARLAAMLSPGAR